MSFFLKDRVALVTGNSVGLGKHIGLVLGRAGAKVPISYYSNDDNAQAALAEYKKAGIETCLAKADVMSESGVAQLFDTVESSLGKPDIVVLNATGAQTMAAFEEYSWSEYQAMLEAFVKSPFLVIQRALSHMKAQGWGRVINIASEVFFNADPNFSAYVAAKGGQVGLSRSLASEFASEGITMNTVAPGWIPVERHDDTAQELKDSYVQSVPMGRFGSPADVAFAVLYFASEQAGFVTNQTLCINGGRTPL